MCRECKDAGPRPEPDHCSDCGADPDDVILVACTRCSRWTCDWCEDRGLCWDCQEEELDDEEPEEDE